MARVSRNQLLRAGMIAPKARGRMFNAHNQGVERANYQGPRGSGFTIEFLGARAEKELALGLEGGAIALRGAAIEAVVYSVDEIKQRLRTFLDSRFPGSAMHGNAHRRVSNAAVQSVYFDDRAETGGITGLIYSKFGARRGGTFIDYLLLHLRGGTITAKGGGHMMIANEEAVGPAWKGANAGSFGAFRIELVPMKGGRGFYLVRRWKGSERSDLLATLIKSLRIEPSLAGLEAILASSGAVLESNFDAAWARREAEART